jgi:hypothetical protein
MENGYTTAMPGKTEIATNLVRRPADGYVMTASGRNVPQPPWIISGDPESAIAYDQWLIEQGRLEVRPKAEVVHSGKRPFGGPLPKIAYSRSTICIDGQGTLSDIFLLTGLLEEAHNEDHVDSRQTDSCIR